MTPRRSAALVAALSLTALTLAGCGGGGDGAADSSTTSTPAAATPAATGVSAVPTSSLFGAPGAVDEAHAAGSLNGYDQFGTPKDAFVQVVRDGGAGGSASGEASTGTSGTSGTTTTPTTTTAPTTTSPLVGVPGGTGTTGTVPIVTTPTTTAPTTTTPTTTTVAAYEADFDIEGEPVVAKVGDAVPPDTQQFTVKSITASAVTLTLNGGLLPNGTDHVTLKEGGTLTLVNQTAGTTYTLKLLDIRTA